MPARAPNFFESLTPKQREELGLTTGSSEDVAAAVQGQGAVPSGEVLSGFNNPGDPTSGVRGSTPDPSLNPAGGLDTFPEFKATFSKTRDQPGFNARFDINSDGVIDFQDFVNFAGGQQGGAVGGAAPPPNFFESLTPEQRALLGVGGGSAEEVTAATQRNQAIPEGVKAEAREFGVDPGQFSSEQDLRRAITAARNEGAGVARSTGRTTSTEGGTLLTKPAPQEAEEPVAPQTPEEILTPTEEKPTPTIDALLGDIEGDDALGRDFQGALEAKLINDALKLDFDPAALIAEEEAVIDAEADAQRKRLARIFALTPGGTGSGDAQVALEEFEGKVLQAKSQARQRIQSVATQEKRNNLQTLLNIQSDRDLADFRNTSLELDTKFREGVALGSLNGQQTLEAQKLGLDETNSALQRAIAQGEATGEFVDPQTGLSQRTLSQQRLDLSAKQLDIEETNSALQRAVARARETGEFTDPETGINSTTLLAKQFDLGVDEFNFRKDTVARQLGLDEARLEQGMAQFSMTMQENARQFDITTTEGRRQFDERMDQVSEQFIQEIGVEEDKLKLMEDQFGWKKTTDKAKGIASALAGKGELAKGALNLIGSVGGKALDVIPGGGIVKGALGGLKKIFSDVAAKTDIEDIEGEAVVAKVRDLPVKRWKYKGGSETHMGPMAQDFKKAFGLGGSDKSIAVVDAVGVNLAVSQQLVRDFDLLKKKIRSMEKKNARKSR